MQRVSKGIVTKLVSHLWVKIASRQWYSWLLGFPEDTNQANKPIGGNKHKEHIDRVVGVVGSTSVPVFFPLETSNV